MFKRLFGIGPEERSGQAPPASIDAMQDDVIRRIVADSADLHDGEWDDREWAYIAVNHELLLDGGARSSTQAVVLAQKPGGALEHLSFRLDAATKQALVTLHEAMAQAGHDPWSVADITVERNGGYAFTFAYGKPPRIGGDLLHRPLNGLLQRYKAERGLE